MTDSGPEILNLPGSQRVPVTLLTGFLGAGKTARLNATLTAGTARVAVIENELGALGVDGALVANRHNDGIVELTNGCLCCSAEVDLIAALEALARRRQTQPFDRVIIETTGLADVAPVVALLRDPEDPLQKDFVFDGVVTIVDAAAFRLWANSGAKSAAEAVDPGSADGPTDNSLPTVWASGFGGCNMVDVPIEASNNPSYTVANGLGRAAMLAAFWRQVALADQIVVSKADLVGEEGVTEVLESVKGVNPLVDVVANPSTTACPLPPPLANNGGGQRCVALIPPVLSKDFCGSSAKRRRGNAAHLCGVDTLTLHLRSDQQLRAEPLQAFIKALLAGSNCRRYGEPPMNFGEAWRVKGLVVIECKGAMILQGVGDQVALDPWPYDTLDAPFLVVIGERLCREQLEEALVACSAGVVSQLQFDIDHT